MSTVRARLTIALAALTACAALAACGGGSDDQASSGAAATTSASSAPAGSADTTQEAGDDSTRQSSGADDSSDDAGSPESRIAPDAQVTAGLEQLKGVGATVAAAGGGDGARDAVEKVWQPIEGTVKKNEPDLYLDVEDSFELLSSGDAAKARQGSQRLDQAIDAYLAKHPG
jgi:hypothetical protein